MGKLIDLTGQVFGRLTVIDRAQDHITSGGRKLAMRHCVCKCGNHVNVSGMNLRKGTAASCGCLHYEVLRLNGKKNKKSNRYETYGEVVIGYTAKGESFYIDHCDLALIQPFSWYKTNAGYIATRERDSNEPILLHRLIMGVDKDLVIDHINHNTVDNRRVNLRVSTYHENMYNKVVRKDNRSGTTGVSWNTQKQKWQAFITVEGKKHHLGFFADKEKAASARKSAEEKYFGEFSYDNSIAAVPRIAV